ncbi:uncharacterized protein METZ01_LOCUS133305, partial [marine metagenome]
MKKFLLLILTGIFSFLFMQCESSNWQSEESHRWKALSPKGGNTGLAQLYSDQT